MSILPTQSGQYYRQGDIDPFWYNVRALFHFDTPSQISATTSVTLINGGVLINSALINPWPTQNNPSGQSLEYRVDRVRWGNSSIIYRGLGYNGWTIPAINNQDFTVELMFSRYSTLSGEVYDFFSVGPQGTPNTFHVQLNSNTIRIYAGTSTTALITTSTTYGDTNWHHLAVTRSGTTTRLYVDGALAGSTTGLPSLTGTRFFLGGGDDSANLRGNFYAEEFRFTLGTARYTGSSFTVQDLPFVMPDLPVFANNAFSAPGGTTVSWPLDVRSPSGKALTYTIQSGSLPSGLTLNASTGVISGTLPANAGANDLITSLTIRASDGIAYTDQVIAITNQANDAQWSNVQLYLPGNGVAGTNAVDASSFARTNTGQSTGSGVVASTQSKWYGSTTATSIQTQSNNFPKFLNDGSLSQAGDFTVEGWFYPTAYQTTSGISALFGSYNTTVGANDAFLLMNGTGLVGLYVNGTATTGGSAAALNTWHHIAWSRSSGVNSVYLNGTRIAQPTYTGTLGKTTQAITVGGYEAVNTNNFIGFIQDLRFTSGVGRYTGTTLTVPTGPYPRMATATQTPQWVTAAGSIGGASAGKAYSFAFKAIPSSGSGTITFALQSGSLPSGVTLNTSTGVISGTPAAVTFDTTYTFTIRATLGSVNVDRTFTLQVWNDDPLFSTVITSLPFIGTNGSVPVEQTGRTTLARAGGLISTSQFKWTTSSAFMNGATNLYNMTMTSSAIGGFNNDFTIETWYYQTANGTTSSTGYIFSAQAATNDVNSLNVGVVSNNFTATWLGGSIVSTGAPVTNNTWHHLAAVRQNGVLSLYVNGNLVGSAAYTGTPTTTASNIFTIGALKTATSTYNLNAYLNDYRVSTVARYSGSSFTPPTFQLPTH